MPARAKRKLTFRLLTLIALILCLFSTTPPPSRANDECENICMLNVISLCSEHEGEVWQECIEEGQCQCAAACKEDAPACGGDGD
jgi:hypothetical protein